MAGNKIGGLKAAETNKQKYGSDFYHNLGKLSWKDPNRKTGGFTGDPERARQLGALGGAKSRRTWTPEERQRHSEIMRNRYKGVDKSLTGKA